MPTKPCCAAVSTKAVPSVLLTPKNTKESPMNPFPPSIALHTYSTGSEDS